MRIPLLSVNLALPAQILIDIMCHQVSDVPAWALGTLLRVARASLPEGCTLNVHEHGIEHEDVRYVPDNQLNELKQQLEEMGGARPEKKKRK